MKLAVTSLLADQSIFPVEFGSSVRVTVQEVVTPQLFPSKAVGLIDQAGGGGGDGLGDGDGVGDGDGDGLGDGDGVSDGDGDGDELGDGDDVGVVPITVSVMCTCALPPFEVILIVAE